MNTEGHRKVGEDVGLGLLKGAITGTDGKPPNMEAFLLGNWLTDMSQVIDPVTSAATASKLLEAVDAFLEQVASHSLFVKGKRYLPAITGRSAEQLMEALRTQIASAVDLMLGKATTDRGAIGDALRDAILVGGYFKFAHAETQSGPQRMSAASYLTVFNARFVQYYPHEHMDRPPVRLEPALYASDLDHGPRSEPGQRRRPDLYRYLRDDIQLLAGDLTQLELDWARPVARREIPVDGSDRRFPLGLARLGYLLHALEDYFAHSNFVELYASSQGDAYLPKTLEARDAAIYARRLKRWSPAASVDWRTLPQEDFVVTGYFDPKDTIVSLMHVAEDVLGWDWQDPGRRVGDVDRALEGLGRTKIEEEYFDWLQSVLQLLGNPEAAFANPENRVAGPLKNKWGDRIEAIQRRSEVQEAVLEEVIANTRFLRGVPKEIRDPLVNFILILTRAVAFGSISLSIYRAVDTVIKLFTVPIELVRKVARDLAIDFVVDSILFLAKDRLLYGWLLSGSDRRIGSHSLLAKDTGAEWLYGYQRACATAAHHVVVKTLLRWFDRPPPVDEKPVDWLHLLESLLVNPLGRATARAELEISVSSTVPYQKLTRVPEAIEQAARAVGVSERDGMPAWLRVAEESFGLNADTRRDADQICAAIASGRRGQVRAKGAAELELSFPDQRIIVVSRPGSADLADGSWPGPVFERERSHRGKGWQVVRGFDDPTRNQSVAGTFPVVPRLIDEAAARRLITVASSKRLDAEQRYNALAPRRPRPSHGMKAR